MKTAVTILFLIITLNVFGQKNQTIELKWKIGKDEKINYLTIMSDIDSSSVEMDFGGLFKALSDSTSKGLKASKNFFSKLNDLFKNQEYVSTLTNKNNGVIDIVLTLKPQDESKNTGIDTTESKEVKLLKMMQAMNQGVLLRGSVYEVGGIHSFWIKNAQKNLIALFFELPTKPVKINDKWSIDTDLIENDQSFECDSSFRINEVKLVDIKTINGEEIAVLKYNIVEYVDGNFNLPSMKGMVGGTKNTMMAFNYQGIAEFSIDKGRWITYDGIMNLKSTGIMIASKKTKFALIDEKNARH